jgi:nucleotide-binding universal stress UspA family protein
MNSRKIVVGVDGSPGSDAALLWAIHEAAAGGAEVIAVHVSSRILPPVSVAMPNYVRLPQFEPPRVDLVSPFPEESIARLKKSGIEHRILTLVGHPATEILRLADEENAVLVVVGNGLRSTMAEIFLGSVAHELTHHSRRPLAIVPAEAPAVGIDVLGRKKVDRDRIRLAAHEQVLPAGAKMLHEN